MRTLILTAFIAFTSATQISALTLTTTVPSTYPEVGTFCGLFTLCDQESASPRGN